MIHRTPPLNTVHPIGSLGKNFNYFLSLYYIKGLAKNILSLNFLGEIFIKTIDVRLSVKTRQNGR